RAKHLRNACTTRPRKSLRCCLGRICRTSNFCLTGCESFRSRFELLPDRAVARCSQGHYMVEVQRTPLSALDRVAKQVLDVMAAAISLVLLGPALIAAAAAIKLESKGPVIFRQRRHGFKGKPFVIYALRTMKVLEDGDAVVQAAKQDARVTRVGRLLRWSSM